MLAVLVWQRFNGANFSQEGSNMETVAGIFDSRADAERAFQGLKSAGIAGQAYHAGLRERYKN